MAGRTILLSHITMLTIFFVGFSLSHCVIYSLLRKVLPDNSNLREPFKDGRILEVVQKDQRLSLNTKQAMFKLKSKMHV